MKQKDILTLAVVAIISGILSLVLTKVVISTPEKRSQEVETINAITADFPKPDSKYFNSQSVDPAQPVEIGTSTNPNPFTGQ